MPQSSSFLSSSLFLSILILRGPLHTHTITITTYFILCCFLVLPSPRSFPFTLEGAAIFLPA